MDYNKNRSGIDTMYTLVRTNTTKTSGAIEWHRLSPISFLFPSVFASNLELPHTLFASYHLSPPKKLFFRHFLNFSISYWWKGNINFRILKNTKT